MGSEQPAQLEGYFPSHLVYICIRGRVPTPSSKIPPIGGRESGEEKVVRNGAGPSSKNASMPPHSVVTVVDDD